MAINYVKDAFCGRPFFVLFLVTDFGSRDFGIYRIFDMEAALYSRDFGISFIVLHLPRQKLP